MKRSVLYIDGNTHHHCWVDRNGYTRSNVEEALWPDDLNLMYLSCDRWNRAFSLVKITHYVLEVDGFDFEQFKKELKK